MQEYSATLTGGPFLYNECKIIGKYLLDGEDPTLLRKKNISDNLIKYKKVNSISRVNSPIFTRLLVCGQDKWLNRKMCLLSISTRYLLPNLTNTVLGRRNIISTPTIYTPADSEQ